MNLLPYIYEQAELSSRTGVPLMRAMPLAYPDDLRCAELTTHYLFGEQLLVAPVVEEGASEREVYFPAGRWLPLFGGGDPIVGGQSAVVAAELTHIPVFVRENGVVPLNLGVSVSLGDDVGNQVDGYMRFTLLVYLTSELAYTFEDDGGNTVTVTARLDGRRVRAEVEVTGSYAVTLLFRAVDHVSSVLVNSEPLPRASVLADLDAGQWYVRDSEVLVTLPVGSSSILVAL